MAINKNSKYKRGYAYLMCQIDRALTILDSGNLLEVGKAREILQTAMDEVEDFMIREMEREDAEEAAEKDAET